MALSLKNDTGRLFGAQASGNDACPKSSRRLCPMIFPPLAVDGVFKLFPFCSIEF
jgi:hypothetical protein